MSALSSGSGGPYRKPRLDIYTVMLALALVAIIIACVVLYLEVAEYGKPPYQLSLAVPGQAHPAASPLAPRVGPEVLRQRGEVLVEKTVAPRAPTA